MVVGNFFSWVLSLAENIGFLAVRGFNGFSRSMDFCVQ
jgi:hypothetical protein